MESRLLLTGSVSFSEIMYHPHAEDVSGEWLELRNPMSVDVDLSGWSVTGGVSYEFAADEILPAGEFLLLAADPASLGTSVESRILGPFVGNLSNGGDELRLLNRSGREIDFVEYDDRAPWPVGADGSGSTLAKRNAVGDSREPGDWNVSHETGGTPGRENFPQPDLSRPWQAVVPVDAEWRWTSDTPAMNWTELLFTDEAWQSSRGPLSSSPVAVDFDNGIAPQIENVHDLPQFDNASFEDEVTGFAGFGDFYSDIPSWNDPVGGPAGVANPANHTVAWFNGLSAPDGQNVAFIQAGGQFSQTATGFEVGRSYVIQYWENERGLAPNGFAQTQVSVEGSIVVPSHRIERGDWRRVVSEPFTATAANQNVVFEHLGGQGDNSALFDLVEVLPAPPEVPNGSFAAPDLSPNNFEYAPANASWTFSPGAGVSHNGGGFMNGGVVAPAGNQVAFLQGAASMEQTVSGLTPGTTYSLSWFQQARLCCTPAFGNDLQVSVTDADGQRETLFDSWVFNQEWTQVTKAFLATTESYTIRLATTNAMAPGDRSILIDDVRLAANSMHPDFQLALPAGPQTTYFRHQFSTPQSATDEWEWRLETLLRDGGVVYLNGTEVQRINLPPGPVTDSTRAEVDVTNPQYFSVPLPPELLQPGENLLAIQLHQNSALDIDSALAVELSARHVGRSTPQLPPLQLQEVGYQVNGDFFVELLNAGDAQLELQDFSIETSAGHLFAFTNQTLASNERLFLSASQLGLASAPSPGERIYLYAVADSEELLVDAVAVQELTVARQDGSPGSVWLQTETPTPGAPNHTELQLGVVINEILYHAPAEYADTPELFSQSNNEWLELYNRSDSSVDLTNWRLRGDVTFTFPANSVLEPGAYLVVPRNSADFATRHPNVNNVTSDYRGTLSNQRGTVELHDTSGNVVDAVTYADDGYWDDRADGGGASLELRSPLADNSTAGSWQASEQPEQHSWEHISYRASGGEPPGTNNPSVFNEFLLGLLAAGEVLLDDIRLIADPDGAAVDLLQNGDFSGDVVGNSPQAWRALGNHRAATVTSDPDDPANNVLHMIATGPTEHMHNHLETTLANGAVIEVGTEYEISYRARWLSGSPQLNSRAYFNQLAHTTLLSIPPSFGTPGARNTAWEQNVGPSFRELNHAPIVPTSDDTVTVSINVYDIHPLAAVTLHYAVEGVWLSMPMETENGTSYSANIPPLSADTVVQFYVEAADANGATSHHPPQGRDSRAFYKVVDTRTDHPSSSLRLLMDAEDNSWMHRDENVMSNDRLGGTLIWQDQYAYYDVGIRLRASGYGRRGALVGFNVAFPSDNPFRGGHNSLVYDRGTVISDGNGANVRGAAGASPHELLYHQIASHAGGIASNLDDVAFLDDPGQGRDGLGQIKLERYSDRYLDSAYEDGADGELFKFELIYYADSTIDGDPESVKRSPNRVLATPITDLGDSKEAYRWNFLIKNGRTQDDYSTIIELGRLLDLEGEELATRAPQVMDVDQWMRLFALQSLVGIADTYNMGLPHNLSFYVRPSDGRVLAMPWDLDHGFFYPHDSPILGIGNSSLAKVIELTPNRRAFLGHLWDLIGTTYNTDYLGRWIDHYTQVTQFDLADFFVDYIHTRKLFVEQEIQDQVPVVDFAITTNNGLPIATDNSSITLAGTAWINIPQIRLAGASSPLPVTWTDVGEWEIELPLSAGTTELVFEALNHAGQVIGEATIEVTSTQPGPSLFESLRVTEVMYHPPAPTESEVAAGYTDQDEFEFIELQNIGASPINIGGVRLSDAIDFTFPTHVMLPGEFVVVVENAAAFVERYDDFTPIGQWSGGLSNRQETLMLADAQGMTIQMLPYEDRDGWSTRADGVGSSLELVDSAFDSSQPNSWRASVEYGGSPGREPLGVPQTIIINEILSHTDLPAVDAIELFNHGDAAVFLDDWYLSDSGSNLRKYRFPENTVIQSGEYFVIDENDFNLSQGVEPTDFALDSARGDEVWLVEADPAGNVISFVDNVQFLPAINGETFGRWPNASGPLYPMLAPTLNGANAGPRVGPLVISELMVAPPDPDGMGPIDTATLEFLEIHNPTSAPVTLQHWEITGGVDYAFADETSIGPGGFLTLVSFDPTAPNNEVQLNWFREYYGLPVDTLLLGPYQGRLENRGERVRLRRPDSPPIEEPGLYPLLLEDEVSYATQTPWPTDVIETGNSLQRIAHDAWGNDPESWRAATPSPGSFSSTTPTVDVIEINAGIMDPADLPGGAQPTSWEQQRSQLTRAALQFSTNVIVTAANVELTNLGLIPGVDPRLDVTITEDMLVHANRRLTIDFADLVDGVYELRIHGVTSVDGRLLDGDDDGEPGGDFVLRGNSDNRFYQLTGDWNGDAGTTIFDFAVFAYWFGTNIPLAPDYADLNRDGGVSIFDFGDFAAGFGNTVVLPVAKLSHGRAAEVSTQNMVASPTIDRDVDLAMLLWGASRRQRSTDQVFGRD